MEEKMEERTNFGPILIGPFLLNLCHGNAVPHLRRGVARGALSGLKNGVTSKPRWDYV